MRVLEEFYNFLERNNIDLYQETVVCGVSCGVDSIVLLDVLEVYSSLENLVLGHSFTVDKPTYDEIELEVTLSVTTAVDTTLLTNNLLAFFDGTGFDRMDYSGVRIDEELSRDKLVSAFNVFHEVVSVDSITVDDSEVTTLTPSPDGVLKLVDVSFTQNEV